MKPLMLFAIVALVSIIIVVSFGLQLAPNAPLALSPDSLPYTLYVCPVESEMLDNFAAGLRPMQNVIIIAFFFGVMLLMFSWGWALYQNLLSDSFKRETFQKPWKLTKGLFWISVTVLLFMMTPNYFRTVNVDEYGVTKQYVLCESNTPGAKAVRADAVYN